MAKSQVETSPSHASDGALSEENIKFLKRTYLSRFSEDDQDKFILVCQLTALNPLLGHIHATARREREDDGSYNPDKKPKLIIQTGIGGLTWVAERTGQLDGFDAPAWCDRAGNWRDVWVATDSEKYPYAARAGCHRKGYGFPEIHIAYWDALAQIKGMGKDGSIILNDMWKRGGPAQLYKCAKAGSIRGCFPNQLASVYITEEIGSASGDQGLSEDEQAALDEFNDRLDRERRTAALEEKGFGTKVKQTKEPPKETPADYLPASKDPVIVDLKKDAPSGPVDDFLFSDEVPSRAKGWWREHVIKTIKRAAYQGKKIGEIPDVGIEQVMVKWVPKVGSGDLDTPEAKLDAEAFRAAFNDLFPREAK